MRYCTYCSTQKPDSEFGKSKTPSYCKLCNTQRVFINRRVRGGDTREIAQEKWQEHIAKRKQSEQNKIPRKEICKKCLEHGDAITDLQTTINLLMGNVDQLQETLHLVLTRLEYYEQNNFRNWSIPTKMYSVNRG